jgi:NADPH:quinone reductase-like Zn-dependent oxidoreductase
MSTMKVVLVRKPGGIDVLEYADVPIPQPKADEVLVRNEFVGVNFIDTYGLPKHLPHFVLMDVGYVGR